jgi:hypothetical protein
MKTRNRARAALFAGLLMTVAGTPTLAQGLDLKGALGELGGLGSGSGSGSSGSGSGRASAMQSGSLGNAAGIIEYCLKNNLLSGNDASSASSLKDKLLGKLSGSTSQPATKDSGYLSGAKGVLQTGTGNSVDLSSNGLKAAASKQVCDTVMEQAKSFL